MKFALAGIVLLSAVSLDSCQWVEDALKEPIGRAVKAAIAEVNQTNQAQVASVQARSGEQDRTIQQLRTELEEVKKKAEVAEWINDASRDNYKSDSAKLSSDGAGYSVARTNLGPAIITLKGLTPYLDGFKVRIWVTVLAPIELTGLKGTISWLEKDPEARKKDDTFFRKKAFSSASTFQGGRYTEIEVVLTPASAAGLKEMFVELKTDQISVGVPRQ